LLPNQFPVLEAEQEPTVLFGDPVRADLGQGLGQEVDLPSPSMAATFRYWPRMQLMMVEMVHRSLTSALAAAHWEMRLDARS